MARPAEKVLPVQPHKTQTFTVSDFIEMTKAADENISKMQENERAEDLLVRENERAKDLLKFKRTFNLSP